MTTDGLGTIGRQIQGLAQQATAPHVVERRDGSKLLYLNNGEMKEIPADKKPLNPEFADFESFVEYAEDLSPTKSAVFVGKNLVRALIDADKPEDSGGSLEIAVSKELEVASSLEGSPKQFQPRDLRRFAKFHLPSLPTSLVDACSRIDFTTQQAAHQAASKNQESLGHSVHREASSPQEIPESVHVFMESLAVRGLSCVVTLELLVNIDLANQVIELQLAPDTMRRALQLMSATIADELRPKPSQPVYTWRS